MAVRALVVQSDPDKALGRIAPGLERAGAFLDVRSPSASLPPIDAYAGLIVLPGLADPVDDVEEIHRIRAKIDEALSARLPVLGLCLGGQLLVQALGGDVYRCSPELGFHDVYRADAAHGDPLLDDAPERFSVFHAHRFAFTAPAGAEVLLTNDVCVQACRVGRAWAFQCHPESTREWVSALAARVRGEDSWVLPQTARFFQSHGVSAEDLERGLAHADEEMSRVADAIAAGFATMLGGPADLSGIDGETASAPH